MNELKISIIDKIKLLIFFFKLSKCPNTFCEYCTNLYLLYAPVCFALESNMLIYK